MKISLLKKIILRFRGEPQLAQLINNGMRVGNNFSFGSGCFFDPSFCFLIEIGSDVTFSSKVHLLAHDASTKRKLGFSKVAPIRIGDNVFIGANVTILPKVKIGKGVIVGAGSVVSKSIPDNEVWAGNPAHFICSTSDYYCKLSKKKSRQFDSRYKIGSGITELMKREMKEVLKNDEMIWVE